MLRIHRIAHIAVASEDLDGHLALFEGLFGFSRTHLWDSPALGVKGARLRVPGAPGQHWVVLAPSGSGGTLREWIRHRGGPGLHHIGAEVPDLDSAREDIESRGLEITDEQPGRWLEASLSPPKHGTGVLWRLCGPGDTAMVGDAEARPVAPSPPGGPTLGIQGTDHVCQAFHDRDELADWYADLAGFVQVWRTPEDAWPDMADLVLNIPGSGICWEVITGRGEDSFVDRFLRRNGPAAHHVTFEVADWEAALAACEAHGVPAFGTEEGVKDGAAWRHAFIHPRHAGGVLVQFFWEERPGVWARADKVPPTPVHRPVGE